MTKRYGRRLVLADVSLRVEAGEFLLVVGPNGAGKTTLLRLLSTYAQPSQGRVSWDSADGTPPAPEHVRRRMGVVAHQPLLYDELTASENLTFVLRMHGLDGVEDRAANWLEAFGLGSRADERAGGLSRGLKQRLALARAFAVEPTLLLLDEPATALDGPGAEALLTQLRAAKATTTVLLATHDPNPYRPLATRTLEVRDAALHDWGPNP